MIFQHFLFHYNFCLHFLWLSQTFIFLPVPSCCFREGSGTPLQYSCMENPMDRGAWEAAVLGVAKSRKWLSDFTFPFHFPALEKEMATHSSILAWRIPGTGEPGGLPSMGSHRVGHYWSDLAAAAAAAASYFFISLVIVFAFITSESYAAFYLSSI